MRTEARQTHPYNSAAVREPTPIQVDLPDELLGPRLLLRPYEEWDAPAVHEAIQASRAELAPWMIWANAYPSLPEALAYVRRARARWLTREDLAVGVFERESNRYLGGSGLTRMNWTIRSFEIGYWIRSSDVGHGYATEATQILTRFAFRKLDARRVELRMDARNERSRRVPERLGFTFEGCLRSAHPDVDGQPSDVLVYALLPDEFARLAWRE